MADWRQSLNNYLTQNGPDILTTDDFRALCYFFTSETHPDGKPAAQRTADKFLKQMLLSGELQALAGKGVFCNTLGLGRNMNKREALGVLNAFSSNDVAIFAGPRAVCDDSGPDGPHWILTSSKRTVIHKGLLGHAAVEPSLRDGVIPRGELMEQLEEFQKGYALSTSCNRNWLGLINELPVKSELFTRFSSDGIDSEIANVYVKTASPELALALLPSLASQRHLYPTNESVFFNGSTGSKLDLNVFNPMSFKTAKAEVDVSNLARLIQSMPPLSEDSDFRRRGFESITAPGSKSISHVLADRSLVHAGRGGVSISDSSFDIPELPSVDSLTDDYGIPETPTPRLRR